MKIKIVGKSHRSGTSAKTGKPYDFTEIHYLGKSAYVEGETCEKTVVSSAIMSCDNILVGQNYEVEFDQSGRLVYFGYLGK